MAGQTCYAPPITLYRGQLGIEATNQFIFLLKIDFYYLTLEERHNLVYSDIISNLLLKCLPRYLGTEPDLKLIERSAIRFSNTS